MLSFNGDHDCRPNTVTKSIKDIRKVPDQSRKKMKLKNNNIKNGESQNRAKIAKRHKQI